MKLADFLAMVGKRALAFPATTRMSHKLAAKAIDEWVPGDMVECGAYAGAQCAAMARAILDAEERRSVYAFDSFQGIPMAGPHDNESIRGCIGEPPDGMEGALVSTGVSACSVDNFLKNWEGWDLPQEMLQIREGWFQDTVPGCEDPEAIAVLRLDGDLYESTKVCLEHLYPRLSPGGFLIIDDYALTGCRKAVDEYFEGKEFNPTPIEGGGGPVYFRKPRPMFLVGLMLARNEDWIIGMTARVALKWCDHLVILDHASTDKTAATLQPVARENPGRLTVLREDSETWDEMEHRQRTLDAALRLGATHCAIIDADEAVTCNMLPAIRGLVGNLEHGQYLSVPMIPLWRTMFDMRTDNCVWTRARLSLAFRLSRNLTWRPAVDGYEHHHRVPYGIKQERRYEPVNGGGAFHMQWANWARLLAKHVLYKVNEIVRWPHRWPVARVDRLYSQALDEVGLETAPVPLEWLEEYADMAAGVETDSEPWQSAEARRVVEEHGREKFKGLNLWGLV